MWLVVQLINVAASDTIGGLQGAGGVDLAGKTLTCQYCCF
jgi:hypothetical protein